MIDRVGLPFRLRVTVHEARAESRSHTSRRGAVVAHGHPGGRCPQPPQVERKLSLAVHDRERFRLAAGIPNHRFVGTRIPGTAASSRASWSDTKCHPSDPSYITMIPSSPANASRCCRQDVLSSSPVKSSQLRSRGVSRRSSTSRNSSSQRPGAKPPARRNSVRCCAQKQPPISPGPRASRKSSSRKQRRKPSARYRRRAVAFSAVAGSCRDVPANLPPSGR